MGKRRKKWAPGKRWAQPAPKPPAKPYYFISYSTGEPVVETFVEYLDAVFGEHYSPKRTPSALTSGASQHDSILDTIKGCAFGVVCLDGMRPNVVYEYGALRGYDRPVLLFRENGSTVDIGHFIGNVAPSPFRPPIDLDKHFSNSKDRFCASWNRMQFKATLDAIWQEYDKLREKSTGLLEIPRPKICT
jgi:hypothetical protein